MKHLHLAAVLAALATVLPGCKQKTTNTTTTTTTVMDNTPRTKVEMTTSLGTMVIELYNETPKHRDNFIQLTRTGFYKGIKFHRVINGFMIQGGDPNSKIDTLKSEWGTGGPGYTLPAEFVDSLHHCKGALAAARLGDMANPRRASSGSQFYIVQSESGCRHLDGQYTVFGKVVEGLDVIDKIAAVETDDYDRPYMPVTIYDLKVLEPEVTEPADSLAAPDSTK